MSQRPNVPPLERSDSVAVTSTHTAASAFGDDIADDAYSVSELSHCQDEKKSRRQSRDKIQTERFAKTKLSLLERKESVQQDVFEAEDPHCEEQRRVSTGSADHSDDVGAVSGESEDSDVTMTTFLSFAQSKFQMKILPTYSCSALPHPLLAKDDRADYLAALAAWVTILRIMGDLPDADSGDSLIVAGAHTPVTSRVKSAFKASYTKKDIDDAHRKYSDLFKDPVGADTKTIPFLSDGADTMLDKVQMICAIGIYRPTLRDELYCQLCKQLTNNPSKNSAVRGWVLLLLFAGSFTPSEKFAPSLTSFLSEGPTEFSEKVNRLLRRTCCSGTRNYPPGWLEFQAAKNGKPLLVPVSFMSSHRILCEVDAASTVLELISHIGERIGLQDCYGYSLYISLHTRISCLGHGQHRIMDAISECEQHTKQMGMRERSTVWRLFFRKEYFSPWSSPGEDPVDADLVYQQVARGITMGEYSVDKEDTLIALATKCYYVEYPDDMAYYNLPTFINGFIPASLQERRPKDYFQDKVRRAFEESNMHMLKPSIGSVKSELAKFAMDNFHILFSRYYDTSKVVAPSLQITEVVIGVNNRGIFVIDSKDNLRLHIEFSEIVDVSKSRHHLCLGVANMEDILFTTKNSEDFYTMVTSSIEELRKRSTVAIAKEDFTQLDGKPESTVRKGDVLELSQTMMDLGDSDTVTVLCTSTKKPCDIPVSLLYVIPTAGQPSESMLERLSTQIRKNAGSMATVQEKHHTLHQFAKRNFRQTSESTITKFLSKASLKRKDVEMLWSYSKDNLKKPLLKRTCNKEDVKKMACHCFATIQSYMSNRVFADGAADYTMSTEWILDPARRNKYLRDEIYCQIIKQLTNNPDTDSANKGWVLLTLLTLLTLPSSGLLEHCLSFVNSSAHPLAKQCKKNLHFLKRQSICHLYTPHKLEHDMIVRQQPNVRIHVFLPNQTTQTLDVDSHSRIYNIKKEIASRLHLKSFHEFSLFLTSQDKVHCLSDRAFYFDCLSHADVYWFKGGNRRNSHTSNSSSNTTAPMMVMMKKIWANSQPGTDSVADQVFHFPQEMPNYLRGYHSIPDGLVPKLAALVYIAQFGKDEKLFASFSDVAPLILPNRFTDNKMPSDVEKSVKEEFEKCKTMTTQMAKTAFLQEISRLTTYGSMFCEVKQRHVKSLPKDCLMAINYSGVHIVDADTKAILQSHSFDSIPNWAYDEKSFTLIVAENGSTSKMLLETSVGHNMDDLLMSYVAWIMNYQMRRKHGHIEETSGESVC